MRRRLSGMLALLPLLAVLTVPLTLFPVAAAGAPDDGGIGGTGYSEGAAAGEQGGIGGTGLSAGLDDETGGIGGTGIIGTVTGFGSIVVNGVHIDYPSRMTATTPLGGVRAAASLRVGHVVEVEAHRVGDRYQARNMRLRQSLAGSVEYYDPPLRRLRVNGQWVSFAERTRFDLAVDLRIGGRVAVSGLWDGTLLRASYIEPADQGPDFLVGPLTGKQADGLVIGERLVRLDASDRKLAELPLGRELQVVGRRTAEGSVIDSVSALPALPFAGRVDELLLEGYPRLTEKGADLAGLTLAGGSFMPAARQVVSVQRQANGGFVQARQVLPVHMLEQGLPTPPAPLPGGDFQVPAAGQRSRYSSPPTDGQEREPSDAAPPRQPPAAPTGGDRPMMVPPPRPENRPPWGRPPWDPSSGRPPLPGKPPPRQR
jgi:hypothetical protein